MLVGIEISFLDGTKDYYDPIDFENKIEETETEYILKMAHEYRIDKTLVKSIRKYDLCELCGFEIKDNSCTKFSCEKNNS